MNNPRYANCNYKRLIEYVKAADENGGYVKFKSEGYMDLVIENVGYNDYAGHPVYSMAHYYVQNGDLMRDPEMTFAVDVMNKTIIPQTYQLDGLGIYQEVFKYQNGKTYYNVRLISELDDFLRQWIKNIISQGFNVSTAAIR